MMWESTEWQYSLKTEAGMGEEKLLRGAREDQNNDFQRRMNLEIRKVEQEGDFGENAWRCDIKALENCEFSKMAETWGPGSIETQNYAKEKKP